MFIHSNNSHFYVYKCVSNDAGFNKKNATRVGEGRKTETKESSFLSAVNPFASALSKDFAFHDSTLKVSRATYL